MLNDDMHVDDLGITAIKGFGLCHPDSVRIETTGAVGDRDFFLVDGKDRLWSVTGHGDLLGHWSRFDPASGVLSIGAGDEVLLEDEVEQGEPVHGHLWGSRYQDAHTVPGDWSKLISEVAGADVRLVRADSPSGAVDVEPVTLVSRASAAALGEETDGAPVDARRFRMLMTLTGDTAFAEDTWAGRELEVGEVRLKVGGEVPRCAAVQRRPGDGARGVNVLKRIAEVRGRRTSSDGQTLNLGVYATVLRPGSVAVGDEVVLRDA
jgi:uncharacterized protein YcbX